MTHLGNGARLELFVRSFAPAGARERQADTVERLRALDDTDGIEAVAVVGKTPSDRRGSMQGERGTSDLRGFRQLGAWAGCGTTAVFRHARVSFIDCRRIAHCARAPGDMSRSS